MRWRDQLALRFRSVLYRNRVESELDEELRYHFEREVEQNVAAGMTLKEARFAARRAIGGPDQLKEECRDARRVNVLENAVRDFRYALRTLRTSPGFTAAAVLSLALGIGANTAIFSLLDQVTLRALPVERPHELVLLDWEGPHQGSVQDGDAFSYPMYRDLRERNTVFSGLAARNLMQANTTTGSLSERARIELVSGNYFEVTGVRVALGRPISAEDERAPGAHPVAVLSFAFWQSRYGGKEDVLGQHIVINGHSFEIIGVSAPRFSGFDVDRPTDIFVPLLMKHALRPDWNEFEDRKTLWANLIGRLRPGVTKDQAKPALEAVFKPIMQMEAGELHGVSEDFRQRFADRALLLKEAFNGRSRMRSDFETPLQVLMLLTGLVLLIACANVANLALARATARSKEIAVRVALGAGRGRIGSHIAAESILLSLAGGALGLLVATWTGDLLIGLLPSTSGAPVLRGEPDARVLAFTLGVSLLTSLVFGTFPAFFASRQDPAAALNESRSSTPLSYSRFRRGLVAAQLGLSVTLLIVAGLFSRSLVNLLRVDLGFPRDQLLAFAIAPTTNEANVERTAQFFDQAREAISRVPGVISVSMCTLPALSPGRELISLEIEGNPPDSNDRNNLDLNFLGPGYFANMGVPLLAGRELTVEDLRQQRKFAIVSESTLREFWPGQNALGKRLGFSSGGLDHEVIGVVRDIRHHSSKAPIRRFAFFPYTSERELSQLTFYVRSARPPDALASEIRRAIFRLDPQAPLHSVRTLDRQFNESIYIDRVQAVLAIAFGALAALLASIGLYGVMAYAVARRTREIGIRIALGAARPSLLWIVLRDAAMAILVGVAAGVPAAYWIGRSIEARLFGMKASDPIAYLGAIALLVAVALVAAYLPARRAAAIEPASALRTE